MPSITRRQFVHTSAALAAASGLVASSLLAQETTPLSPGVNKPPPKPAALPPEQVQAAVVNAHGNLEKLRALIAETPLLVNACWDQGGGDFETPLEAAAHMGRREIAEFLLAHHARPSLFASAMLGELEPIKAALALNPGAHAIPGPHGFTLLHCAKQGGEKAKAVFEFLRAHGAPEIFQRPLAFKWPSAPASQ